MWQDFFFFSKTEKRGAFVLMLLSVFLLAAPYFWPDASQEPATDFSSFQRAVANWQSEGETSPTPTSPVDPAMRPSLFDPNAPDKEVLAALDLSERAIRAWMSYTAKGGRFRHPVDLDKFRALTEAERTRVKPYLQFPETTQDRKKEEQSSEKADLIPLQPFDPNQITKEELIAFGVPAKAAANWSKFLEAGGRFHQAADVGKIYGLPTEWSERLVAFAEVEAPASNMPTSRNTAAPKAAAARTPVTIDINQATVEDWQQLYGIGPALSARIVKFRDKLGGFYRPAQVGETYGLPDSTFQRILPQLQASVILRPIYINQATEQELAAHPYIHRLSAQLIANYRREHGAFQSISDLDKLYGLEEGFVEKLKPYLVFE